MATHRKELRVSKGSLSTNPLSLLNKHSKQSRVSDFLDITMSDKFLWAASSFLKNNAEWDVKEAFIYIYIYIYISQFKDLLLVFGDFACLSMERPSTKVMDLFFFYFLDSKGQFVNCWEEGAKSNYLGLKC